VPGGNNRLLRTTLQRLEPCMPHPWSIDGFAANLAEARERATHLIAWPLAAIDVGLSGMWIPTRVADYLFYERHATPSRREAIIGHELGHLVFDHAARLQDAPDDLLVALAPSVPPDLARRVLSRARTTYADDEESLAETFGTALVRAGHNARTGAPDTELGRLTRSLR
jgi:hypothetical protein